MDDRTALRGVIAGTFLAGIWIACLLGLARADPVYQSQTYACTHAAQTAGTAGTIQLVASSGSIAQIYVCGWDVVATAAATWQLEYGTGATCGSGTTTITPAFSLAANGIFIEPHFYYDGIPAVPNGNNLCVVIGGTGPAPTILYYSQF